MPPPSGPAKLPPPPRYNAPISLNELFKKGASPSEAPSCTASTRTTSSSRTTSTASFERWNQAEVVACASSFSTEEKEELRKDIEGLKGAFYLDLRAKVNVLIAKDNVSEKYLFALRKGIPIVTQQWVLQSFREGHFVHPKHFLFPRFSETRFFFHDKKDSTLAASIEKEGGTLVDAIDLLQCQRYRTHILITDTKDEVAQVRVLLQKFPWLREFNRKGQVTFEKATWVPAYLENAKEKIAAAEIALPEDHLHPDEEEKNDSPNQKSGSRKAAKSGRAKGAGSVPGKSINAVVHELQQCASDNPDAMFLSNVCFSAAGLDKETTV